MRKVSLEMLNEWRASVSEETMEIYMEEDTIEQRIMVLEVGYLGYIDQLEVLIELISEDSSDVELELLHAEADDIRLKVKQIERLIQKTKRLMSKDEE